MVNSQRILFYLSETEFYVQVESVKPSQIQMIKWKKSILLCSIYCMFLFFMWYSICRKQIHTLNFRNKSNQYNPQIQMSELICTGLVFGTLRPYLLHDFIF